MMIATICICTLVAVSELVSMVLCSYMVLKASEKVISLCL